MAANVTFDGPNLLVQVDAGIEEIDVRAVYSAWKDWTRLSDNSKYLPAYDVVGGDDLGGGLFAPIYFFLLNGWTIRPDDTSGSHELTVSLNQYARPATNDRFTPVSGVTISNQTSDAAITNIDLLEFSSFQNRVTIDSVYGTAGTAFPLGTVESPVDNVPDALLIAAERGIGRLHFKSDHTITTGQNLAGYEIWGEAPSRTTITFNTGSITFGTELFNCSVEGYLGAIAGATGVHFLTIIGDSNLTGREVHIHESIFEGTITLSSGFGGEIQVIDCYSGVAGTATPMFDLNGSDTDIVVRNYSGGMELHNITQGQVGSIDVHSGQVIFDSSCTSGTITVRGRAKVTDNSVGLTVNDETSDTQIDGISAGGSSGPHPFIFNVGPLGIPLGAAAAGTGNAILLEDGSILEGE